MLSEKTEKLYQFYLDKTDKAKIDDIEYVKDHIKNKSPGCKKLILSAILRELKPETDKTWYQQEISKCIKEELLLRIKRKPTEKEDEGFIPWRDVLQYREEYRKKKKTLRDHMKYVVLCLYTYIPPLRGQCYYNCYVNKQVEGSNELNLNTGELILYEYKTKKAYGTKIIHIPDELKDVLNQWYDLNGNKELLLFNTKEQMMTESAFAKFMNSIFNTNTSCSMLRKIYISEHINADTPLEERETLAAIMGHSAIEQEFYYKKEFN